MERVFETQKVETEEADNNPRELTLRPKCFDEFPGQSQVKKKLQVFVSAAKSRQEPLDHCLLCGPPRPGKDDSSPYYSPRFNGGF